MVEIKTNMYVRTKEGITQYKEYETSMGKLLCMPLMNGTFANIEDILKTSNSIIDLIEAGDLMYIDISPDNCGGIVVPRVAETEKELEKWKKRFDSGECILKAFLTKEQIINNWYEVNNYGIMEKYTKF